MNTQMFCFQCEQTTGGNTKPTENTYKLLIKGMAAYAYHSGVLGYTDERVSKFFAKTLLCSRRL